VYALALLICFKILVIVIIRTFIPALSYYLLFKLSLSHYLGPSSSSYARQPFVSPLLDSITAFVFSEASCTIHLNSTSEKPFHSYTTSEDLKCTSLELTALASHVKIESGNAMDQNHASHAKMATRHASMGTRHQQSMQPFTSSLLVVNYF
jgi:hypothetical protein